MAETTQRQKLSQESWAVIGTGVTLLVALGGVNLTHYSSLQEDIRQLRGEMQQLRGEMRRVQLGQTEIRERLARLETTIIIAHPNLNAQFEAQVPPNS